VPTPEPYAKRTSHGLIMGEDGEKMSKSRGNVVNPDTVVEQFGADTFRVYEMFMGPFDQSTPWSDKGVTGVRRFIERVWDLAGKLDTEKRGSEDTTVRLLHKTIKKITDQIETLDLNTCVSALMILVNAFAKDGCSQDMFETFLKLISPFAPHIAEELWHELGNKKSIFLEKWPEHDPALAKDFMIELPVQINGKIRSKIMITEDDSDKEVQERVLADASVQKWLDGKKPEKVVYIKGRIVNLIVGQ